jgi:hypothetical protein
MVGNISRQQVLSAAQRLRTEIQKNNIVHPQEMFSPSLVHPYGEQPPGGPTVLRETEQFLENLGRYAEPTVPQIAMRVTGEVAHHTQRSLLMGLGGAALIVGAVATCFFGPAGKIVELAGSLGAAGAGAFIGCAVENKKSRELNAFSENLIGWAQGISDPDNCVGIPASDGAVPFEYMQYVEGRMISQRRSAAGYP